MKAFSLRVIALASIPAFGACADTGTTSEEPQGFKITVAPLELDGIGDACYDITVSNGTDDVVVLTDICSSQYGNQTGGDITYIAPCDSTVDSDGDTENGVQNKVTVWPTLHTAAPGNVGNELTDWEDPCGSSGCTLHADCDANSDTLVEFNFTIMREAQQGFFDVAVNFNNIFCSAKIDSCYRDENGDLANEIALLHGANGREHTAVAAVACTAGPESAGTAILLDGPVVDCAEADFALTLADDDGGNETATSGIYTIDYAVYFGNEDLLCDGDDCEKVYYNIAINLQTLQDQGLTNCRFVMTATAEELNGNVINNTGVLSDANGIYPALVFGGPTGVALTGANGDGLCFAHALNDTANTSALVTGYIAGSEVSTGNALSFDADFSSNGGQATSL